MDIVKERRFFSRQQEISFKSSAENFELVRSSFLKSELGLIYQSIPWQALVKEIGLHDKSKGPKSIFSPEGKIALMFLKQYDGSSDKRLLEQLNGNIHYQLFCDLLLPLGDRLTNHKIISDIRVEIAKSLSIDCVQKVLSNYWRPYMTEKTFTLMDATCYESSVRYPTNVKLLWESVHWSHIQLVNVYKQLGHRKPRTKYDKWAIRYHKYSRKRRRSKQSTRSITRAFLKLLRKNIDLLDGIDQTDIIQQSRNYNTYFATIKKVYAQQYELFTTGVSVKNRIISLSKPYLRPIVRGKEVKSVEFGAKVNKMMIDGISFIEHVSFDNFNEGTRFISTIQKAQLLTKTKTTLVGADAIYATNNNRTYCSTNTIKTDFVRKGKAGKNESHRLILAKQIKKERASRLEGSFGNEKENYNLKRIKARTKQTEILWIFFGIHTANAMQIGKRIAVQNQQLKLTG